MFAGLSTLDVIHHVDVAPGANEKLTARSQTVCAGGPATNAAVTFAALGGDAVLLTALGVGPGADLIRADLHACGVRVIDAAADRTDPVPISSIVVTATGDRSVVSLDAAATVLDAVPDLSDVIAAADVVLIDGHHAALAVEAARAAAAASVPLVLDGGRWRPVMNHVLPNVDVAICSADFRYPGADDPTASGLALVERGVPTVLVTRGPDPVLWWQRGYSGAVKPPSTEVVDTTGAGDVFHGAFCYRNVDELVDAIVFANDVAALKCRYPGTRDWLRHLHSMREKPAVDHEFRSGDERGVV